jgi:hypothetical protein
MDRQRSFLSGALTWLGGDPSVATCTRCGYDWTTSAERALARIEDAPARYAALLDGRDGMVDAEDGGWNATSYVWHLADLARGWSERWVVLRSSPGALLAGWDPDELAEARNYRGMPTVSALWELTTSVSLLSDLSREIGPATEFLHGDWGIGTVGEALVWLGHEFLHHELDVRGRAGHGGSAT